MQQATAHHKPSEAGPRLIFANRFYAPDISATAQILTDVTEHLAEEKNVHVVCSRMSYDGTAKYSANELLNGVRVHRVWSTRFGRQSTIGRAFDYITFYVSASIYLLFHLRGTDTLVAKTDPPMISVPLGLIARLKRARLINWLQDIFPEVAQNLGLGSSEGFGMRLLKRLRNRSLSRAHKNVVIGQRMRAELEEQGIPPEKITVINNFVDDLAIVPLPDHSPMLRREWGIDPDDYVIGYSGNLGRAHDLQTILDVAVSVRDQPDIKFLFIGGGHLHGLLSKEIKRYELSNVVLRPYQPRSRLKDSLALPNLHWASLIPALEGFIVPSKLYGIAAAGRPLLMIGDPQGEIGQALKTHNFGQCVPPGDNTAALRFIVSLKQNEIDSTRLGHNARNFIETGASRKHALNAWMDLISNPIEGS